MHDGAPANVGYAPGQHAGLYVDAICEHLRAMEALIASKRVTVAPWPLVRAELELAGRIAWLLEPELGVRSGTRRVARFYLEAISSFQRARYTASRTKSGAKPAKAQRDAMIAEARSVFNGLDLDLTSMDKIESWTIADEEYLNVGAATTLFGRLCFANAAGLYDHLSDYAHPSLVSVLRQTTKFDLEGITTRPWVVPDDVV